MMRRILTLALAMLLAVAAACSNTPSAGGGGSAFKLPDGGKSAIDGVTGTGTGSGDDKTCATVCAAAANADATCNQGTCGYACHAGYLDCDGKVENGCEIDSNTNQSHCGTCETVCGDVPNGSPSCANAKCAAACDPGWQVCKSDPLVCDTNTDSDETHCGDCNTECPGGPQATPRCVNAACTLKCTPGWANCNNNADDGCEVNITNDPQHCGSCGLACDTNQCVNSACQCASATQTATLIPLDIFIMMDQSGSMGDQTGTNISKWEAVKQALNAFVGDPASAGIGVGIQYFPITGTGGSCPSTCGNSTKTAACEAGGGTCIPIIGCVGCGGGGSSCTIGDYAKPEVGIGMLPANGVNITASINKHGPTGSTPTAPALSGAIEYAKTWATQNPTHTVVVAFATDGDPTECSPQDIPSIANIAKGAANGTPKVLTFVIGVGSSLSSLNAIAAGGGTNQAFVVDTNGNVVQQFGAALKAIQGKALGCQYAIPVPTNGQPIDYTKVNVQLTLGGGAGQLLGYVTDESKCSPTTGGWHYDDPLNPGKILLCGDTCKAVSADDKAKVDIQLGCPRIGKDPGTP